MTLGKLGVILIAKGQHQHSKNGHLTPPGAPRGLPGEESTDKTPWMNGKQLE